MSAAQWFVEPPKCDKPGPDDALAVTIDANSVVWLCHRCGFKGGSRDRGIDTANVVQRQPQRDLIVYAKELWLAASFVDAIVECHPYAMRKGITGAGGARRGNVSGRAVGQNSDCIIVPIYCDAIGKLQAVQAINSEGEKQTFGPVNGGCLVLGNTLDINIPWFVAEGWASAYSVVFHHKHGNAVCAVAFGKFNLDATAPILERVFNPCEITILREDDT